MRENAVGYVLLRFLAIFAEITQYYGKRIKWH